ncbi:MAG: uroporphyrinogen decarboxylase family protein [Desulfopila sp.]|jgi:uroporphyrinogen decarboxylase|nr:uroporphyrinogen decarboxylase family protein [Desulfopila sp.]
MDKNLKEVYSSAEGIAQAQILARELFYHDNVMSPWGCLLVEAEALGTKLKIKRNGYPTISEYVLKSVKEHGKLKPEAIRSSKRVKTIKKSIEILKEKIGKEAFICGATVSPMMLAFQVIEGSRLCIEMLKSPAALHALLEKLTESCIFFADVMLEAGADGILVENGESTADLFSPQMAEEFMMPYTKRLYDRIKEGNVYRTVNNS